MTGAADEVGVFEWEGGSLDELLGLLGEAALSAKVEAVRPGNGQEVGGLSLVAGGVMESAFGEQRGDAALAAMKRIPGLRFRIKAALPHPDEGSVDPEGPREGKVADRPVGSLMRYCEDFVLTGALEINRGTEHARISYRRGEIVRTLVDGSEAPERLPDVIGWTEGQWKIVLPKVNLPRPRKIPAAATPAVVPPSGTLYGFPAPEIPGRTTPAAPFAAASTAPPAGAAPTAVPIAAAAAPPDTLVRDLPTLPSDLVVSLPATPIDVPVVLPASLPPPPSTLPTPGPVPTLVPRPVPAPSPRRSPTPLRLPTPAPFPLAAASSPSVPQTPLGARPSTSVPRVLEESRATPPPRLSLPVPAMARARPAPRGFTDLPLVVHVLLGVVLGAVIVAGYWAYLSLPPGGIPGLR